MRTASFMTLILNAFREENFFETALFRSTSLRFVLPNANAYMLVKTTL